MLVVLFLKSSHFFTAAWLSLMIFPKALKLAEKQALMNLTWFPVSFVFCSTSDLIALSATARTSILGAYSPLIMTISTLCNSIGKPRPSYVYVFNILFVMSLLLIIQSYYCDHQ